MQLCISHDLVEFCCSIKRRYQCTVRVCILVENLTYKPKYLTYKASVCRECVSVYIYNLLPV